MNITELNFIDYSSYIDNNGIVWEVHLNELYNKNNLNITEIYNMKEICNLNFEKYTDWSKVAVDAKIIYTDNNGSEKKGHFAEVINDTVYVWINGCTSFTTNARELARNAKLYIKNKK